MLWFYFYYYLQKTSLCFSFPLWIGEKPLKLKQKNILLDKWKYFLLLKAARQRPLRIFYKTPEWVENHCLQKYPVISQTPVPLQWLVSETPDIIFDNSVRNTVPCSFFFPFQSSSPLSNLFTSVPHYLHFEAWVRNALSCNCRIFKSSLISRLQF